MAEKLVDLLFWVVEIWGWSADPILNQYRSYQRGMVASASGMLFVLLLEFLFQPDQPIESRYAEILMPLIMYFNILLDAIILACLAAFVMYTVLFWRFCTKE